MNKKTLWITQTAIMLALLIVLQFATKSMGQFVTGSCVNFVLVMTALLVGLSSGIVVAVISPFMAFLLGIGPAFLPLVPCIAAGNAVIVIVSYLLWNKVIGRDKKYSSFVSVWIASVCKFIVLYLLVTKLAVPSLGLPEAKQAAISAMFSWPQLVTALIGGTVAAIIAPLIAKAIAKGE